MMHRTGLPSRFHSCKHYFAVIAKRTPHRIYIIDKTVTPCSQHLDTDVSGKH